MKTYIKTTLTILISGMLFSSCEDQLNQANLNQATEDTFWKDETDFNLALTSCYTPLKNALNGGYYGTRGVMLRIARADEVDFRNDISDVYTVNRFTNSQMIPISKQIINNKQKRAAQRVARFLRL